MFRTAWFRVLMALGSLLVFASGGYSDSSITLAPSTAAPTPLIQTMPVQSGLTGNRVSALNPSVSPAAALDVQVSEDKAVGAEVAEVMVIEMPPKWLSRELVRGSAYRYPDHDLAGRFVEMSTELPPMFGDEE